MNKIGILTFHRSLNYGSALQAFALVKKLRALGYDAEVIDYTQKNYDNQYALLKASISKKDIIFNMIHLLYFKALLRREKMFASFWKKYLFLSQECFRYGDDLSVLKNYYNTFICGSDQIWNAKAVDFDTNYFLPFVKEVKKISYAASMNGGSLEATSDAELIKNNLLLFSDISVREKSGKENLDNFLNGTRDISVVLDPTLLHEKEVYDEISASRLVQEPYIFFYSINFHKDAIEAVESLSKRTGIPVYTLFAGKNAKGLLKARMKFHVLQKNVSPQDFISLVKYAEYVVTNSFHGTAFSIIYEKKFYSIGCDSGNGQVKRDERICDGLESLGLSERFVTKEQLKIVSLEENIDYQKVGKLRKELIQNSVDYLVNAIER